MRYPLFDRAQLRLAKAHSHLEPSSPSAPPDAPSSTPPSATYESIPPARHPAPHRQKDYCPPSSRHPHVHSLNPSCYAQGSPDADSQCHPPQDPPPRKCRSMPTILPSPRTPSYLQDLAPHSSPPQRRRCSRPPPDTFPSSPYRQPGYPPQSPAPNQTTPNHHPRHDLETERSSAHSQHLQNQTLARFDHHHQSASPQATGTHRVSPDPIAMSDTLA